MAGAPGAPAKLAAQEASPATPATAQQTPVQQTTAPQAAAPAAATEQAGTKESSEEDETNVYRHAPVVQTMANLLHLDLETTARLLETVNFLVVALLILIPLGRFLPKVMRQRTQTLRRDVNSAQKMTEEARARLGAVEAQLSRLDEEIAAIRTHVEEESRQDEQHIKASMDAEKSRIVAAAEQEISASAAQAQRELRSFAADLAIEQAARQLVLTPETDRALIAEFVSDVDRKGLN